MLNKNSFPFRSRWSAFLWLSVAVSCSAQGRTFLVEGSDSGAGLGARSIAMGGAGVAISRDIYAAYYNPAGLADLDGAEISASRQLNATLQPVNFLGISSRLPLDNTWGLKVTAAAVYYPRIHAQAAGAFSENEIQSVFLRYLLPNLPGTFDGEIDSKTKVYRLAFGIGSEHSDRWSVGVNLDRIDCRTNFCGIHATSNGYTSVSGGATATSFGAGFKYRPNPALTLAGVISDLNSQLNVAILTTDNAGSRLNTSPISFPIKTVLGAAYQFDSAVLVTGDYEMFKGHYGSNNLDWQFLRVGTEISHSPTLTSRYGALVPVVIRSSQLPEKSLPVPFSPTFGMGYDHRSVRADLAIYAHPLMTLHQGKVAPTMDLSLTFRF